MNASNHSTHPSITINPIFFDGADIGKPELSFTSWSSPVTQLFLEVLRELEQQEELRHPRMRLDEDVARACGWDVTSHPNWVIPLDVVLIDRQAMLDELFVVVRTSAMSAKHLAITRRPGTAHGVEFPPRHRVMVDVSEELLAYQMNDNHSDVVEVEIRFFLEQRLREILCAVHFIEAANGMTPEQVAKHVNAGRIDLNAITLCGCAEYTWPWAPKALPFNVVFELDQWRWRQAGKIAWRLAIDPDTMQGAERCASRLLDRMIHGFPPTES